VCWYRLPCPDVSDKPLSASDAVNTPSFDTVWHFIACGSTLHCGVALHDDVTPQWSSHGKVVQGGGFESLLLLTATQWHGICARRALAPPCLLLCFASVTVWTKHKNITISDRWPLYLFYFDSETISAALATFVFWGRRLKRSSTFWGKKAHPGDLARGCSDLEMTSWLLCCAVAATGEYTKWKWHRMSDSRCALHTSDSDVYHAGLYSASV